MGPGRTHLGLGSVERERELGQAPSWDERKGQSVRQLMLVLVCLRLSAPSAMVPSRPSLYLPR